MSQASGGIRSTGSVEQFKIRGDALVFKHPQDRDGSVDLSGSHSKID